MSNISDDFKDWHLMTTTPSGKTLAVNCLSDDFYFYNENNGKISPVKACLADINELRNTIEDMEKKQLIVRTDFNLGSYNPALAWREWDVDIDGDRRQEN